MRSGYSMLQLGPARQVIHWRIGNKHIGWCRKNSAVDGLAGRFRMAGVINRTHGSGFDAKSLARFGDMIFNVAISFWNQSWQCGWKMFARSLERNPGNAGNLVQAFALHLVHGLTVDGTSAPQNGKNGLNMSVHCLKLCLAVISTKKALITMRCSVWRHRKKENVIVIFGAPTLRHIVTFPTSTVIFVSM